VSDMGIIMTENIYRRLAAEPERPYAEVVYDAACEVGGAILSAVTNTIISFIPVFALTGPEGKMFQPLAYTKTFAIAASVILAITVVPVMSYYLLKPVVWSRRRSLFIALAAGVLTIMTLRAAVAWGLGLTGSWTGWPTA